MHTPCARHAHAMQCACHARAMRIPCKVAVPCSDHVARLVCSDRFFGELEAAVAEEFASLSRRDAARDPARATPSANTPLTVTLSYVDDDGDRVGVASDGALREAVAAAREAGKDRLHLDAHGEAREGTAPAPAAAAAAATAAAAAAAAATSAASAVSAAATAAAARLSSWLSHAHERADLLSVSAVALAAGTVLAVAVARRWR